MVSSPKDTVFWTFQTDGAVFGPFICRNHFAFYLNLCLGLTTGLFLGTQYFLPDPHSRHSTWREMFAIRQCCGWRALGAYAGRFDRVPVTAV